MANWYLDYDGGSDNNGGDSFAVTLTAADGVANGTTTFTSATGGFTGLSGRKIYIVGRGGRTISSVTNTNTVILNAVVTTGTGLTFNVGGRRQQMLNMTAANCQGLTSDDIIRIMGSAAPTSLGVDAVWPLCNQEVMLLGSSNTTVSDCESNWTALTNITCALDNADFMVGSNSLQVTIAAAFTTGRAAYFATGTIDLSARRILTFWIKQTSGTPWVAGDLTIRLCSDTAGVTAVNTFSLPNVLGGNRLDQWHLIAIDLGTNAGAAIASIAIYVAVDRAAQVFKFDNFVIYSDSSTIVKNITTCDSAWTASANVTATASTNRRQGTNSASIAIAAGFTTGMAAYFPTGTIDLSAYKQVSFWINQTSGTLLTNARLRLCSDALGATPVNDINIPDLTGLVTNRWTPITVNYGAALSASIQSINLSIGTDSGAQTILIDHIIACKDPTSADSLSLCSLIGRPDSTGAGGSDNDTWYPIRSIVGNTIIISDGANTSAATQTRGYSGIPAITGIYKRETIKQPRTWSQQTFAVAGTSGHHIVLDGGWDRTNMSTQDLETWIDLQSMNQSGLSLTGGYTTINKICMVRATTGFSPNAVTVFTFTNCAAVDSIGNNIVLAGTASTYNITSSFFNNSASSSFFINASYVTITGDFIANNCTGSGISFNSKMVFDVDVTANNNSLNGIICPGSSSAILVSGDLICNNNGVNGIIIGMTNVFTSASIISSFNGSNGLTFQAVGNARMACESILAESNLNVGVLSNAAGISTLQIANLTTNRNVSSGVRVTTIYGIFHMYNCSINDTTEIGTLAPLANAIITSTNHDQTANNHWLFTDGGTCNSQIAERHTASGIAWQMNPTSTNRSVDYPLEMSLGEYSVPAGSITIKCWMRRTNTGLTMKLNCQGGTVIGIDTDVEASMTVAANTWEELSITITPTVAGVISLRALAYGGTTYTGYVDDLTIMGNPIPLNYVRNGQPWADPVNAIGVASWRII